MRPVGRSASIVRVWLLARDADQGLQLGHAASEVEAVQGELLGLSTETFDGTGLVADQEAGDDRVPAVQDDGDSVVRPCGCDDGVAEGVGATGFTGDRDARCAAALGSIAHGVHQIRLGLHEDRHALGAEGLAGSSNPNQLVKNSPMMKMATTMTSNTLAITTPTRDFFGGVLDAWLLDLLPICSVGVVMACFLTFGLGRRCSKKPDCNINTLYYISQASIVTSTDLPQAPALCHLSQAW